MKINIYLPQVVEEIIQEAIITILPNLTLEVIKVIASTGDVACIAESDDVIDFYKLGIIVKDASNWVENNLNQ